MWSEGTDPRPAYIRAKYAGLKRVVAFSSSKGGVGKSTLAAAAAMLLARQGWQVGLVDLDLYGPSAHLMLGAVPDVLPQEDRGVVPVLTAGVHFMSVVYFTRDGPLVMRGKATSDATLELLTIANWPPLDLLIVDMPPGLGDVILDVGEHLPAEFVVVATPSQVALAGVKRLIGYLADQGLATLGVVENMRPRDEAGRPVESLCRETGLRYLGAIGYHRDIEDFYGRPDHLLGSGFGRELQQVLSGIVGRAGGGDG